MRALDRVVMFVLGMVLACGAAMARPDGAAAHAGNKDPLAVHGCVQRDGLPRIVDVNGACGELERAIHFAGTAQLATLAERVTTLQTSVTTLEVALAAAQARLGCLHMDGPSDLVVEGCNLHVRSGTGSTFAAVNGLGNLIVGYNENPDAVERTGSHNVVIGPQHRYTSYGGLIAGGGNSVTAPYASVTGGTLNTASGFVSSVSGGTANTASGEAASVSGGAGNVASGFVASVSGGDGNTASDVTASVCGGSTNTASGNRATVCGGDGNTASGSAASVGGGQFNTASGDYATVSGGGGRAATGYLDWTAGSLTEDF